MMDNELRQAAERLRAWKIDVYHCNMATVQKDTMTLAEAHISEHLPDDDEPITIGWLNERFRKIDDGWRVSSASKFGGVWVFNRRGLMTVCFGMQVLISNPTRGQLRLLYRALGVEVK